MPLVNEYHLVVGKIRVLVADSQGLFSDCLACALGLLEDMDVWSQRPCTGEGVIDAALIARPDVILLDYWIQGMEGPAATAAILAGDRNAKVVLLSWMHLPRDIPAAFSAGAVGFLPKDSTMQQVADAVRRVHQGASPVYAGAIEDLSEDPDDETAARWHQLKKLTRREIQILRLLGGGQRTEEIAKTLSLSHLTVKRHVHNIFTKTETGSQLEALALARHHGIIGR